MSEEQVQEPPKGFFLHSARFLVRWRRPLFFLMVVLVIASLFFVKNIKIDNSLEVWFLEGDPTLTGYREFKKQYGNDEVIVALIDCGKQGGVFSPEMLARLYETSKALEADKANFKRIISVGVAPYIGLQGQDLIVEDLMATAPTSLAEAELIRKRFYENPLWKKLLLEPSERYAIFIIEPVAGDDMDKKRPEIIEAARKHLQTYSYKLAGMGVMYDELNRLSLRDGAIFSSVSYVVIAVLIYVLYRSWVFFSIVVTVMILGGASFMGVFGLCEQNFNMVTIVLPTLMMILSISDVTYIINIYCFRIDKVVKDREEGLIEVFADCLSPCLFTSITNGMGFFSIMASPMEVLRGFGLLAGISCFLEYFISMFVAAYILGRLTPDPHMKLQRPFEGWMDGWVKKVPSYNRLIMLLLVLTTGTGLYGISLLQVDTYSMGFLHENNPVRRDSDAIESTYGNYLPLEVRLMTGKEDGIKQPDFLKRLEKAHGTLEAISGVERAASIVDVICRLNQVWTDGASSSYRVPDEFNQVSQLLMMYESDPDNDLEHMVNRSYSEARLTVRLRMVSASWLRAYEEKVRLALEQTFAGTDVKIVFGGYVPLYSRLIEYLTVSQVSSFGWALLTIFGTMAFLLKRIQAMFLGIIPNLYPIIMTMGMMGILGIRLDIATVTIASISLGIAVDDTIHELFLFYHPHRQHLDPVESISETLIEAGPAVIVTSIIYALGFSALVLASIKSVILFGGLLALTIIFSMLCEITILPALVCTFKSWLSRT